MNDRQRRNKNLKITVAVILFGMLILLLLNIILLFKVGSMQKQIDAIEVAKAQAAQAASAGADGSDETLEKASETPEETETPDAAAEPTASEETAQATLSPDASVVYLTFDDGPSDNTENILAILEQYDVKATFFVNGRTDDDSIARYKAISEAGHEIAMHSYTHDYEYVYGSLANFVEDLEKIQNLVTEVTGKTPMVYRFPGGSSNTLSVRQLPMTDFISELDSRGIVYFDWNVDSTDGEGSNIDAQTLISETENGLSTDRQQNVVLMHDAGDHDTTVEALPTIIQYCIDQGFTFDVITSDTPAVHHSTIS